MAIEREQSYHPIDQYTPEVRALIDEETGEDDPKFKTSVHEIGHKLVAKIKGLFVPNVNIIRRGNTLGSTSFLLNPGLSLIQNYKAMIAACFASKAAEAMTGNHDHRGCGSDLNQA